jgi:hypothetical protein
MHATPLKRIDSGHYNFLIGKGYIHKRSVAFHSVRNHRVDMFTLTLYIHVHSHRVSPFTLKNTCAQICAHDYQIFSEIRVELVEF